MADKYVIVSSQNLIGLQNSINTMLAQGYQPLGPLVRADNMFYQGMANLTGVPVAFSNVTGVSDLFRQVSAINDKDLFRQALGGLFLGYNADNAKPGNWQPSPADIADISDTVRTLLNANTPLGIRNIIGAGSSNLALGSGADQAKPGNWLPDVSDIKGASDTVQALMEANNEAGARAAIGAGTSNLVVGKGADQAKAGDWLPKNTDIQGLSNVLVSLLAATDQPTARAAIGAGSSNLAIGTNSDQAKAGNWQPKVADVSDVTLVAIQNLLKSTGTALSSADRAALKTILGFGQSDLAIGTTATTAKAGNYAPAVDELTNASDLGKALVKAATVAAALQIITGNTPNSTKFLRGDGTWQDPVGTTYSAATTTSNGLMSASDKQRLDNISQPLATTIGSGGRPIGTAFMLDSARWADVTYSFSASIGSSLAANSSLTIDAQVDGATVARLSLGLIIALSVTLGLNLPFTHSMTFRVPPGKQVKFVQSGTAGIAVTLVCGQEVLL